MFEVTFKAQHDCPYVRFSTKHPDVKVVGWCNDRTDVLEVECLDIETYTRIERDLAELCSWGGSKILKKTFGDKNLQVVMKTCRCNKIPTNISNIIEKNSCLTMPPTIYYGGWEQHRVMGFRESDYKKLFQDLTEVGPVQILQKKLIPEKSIRDAFVVSLSSIFFELTDKQISSLLAALDYGYYQIPKKVTAEDIALKNDVPRTTYEEHLRKAESKILQSIAPYVRMYATKSPRLLERTPQITAN
jgi:predicted DNA binding protein